MVGTSLGLFPLRAAKLAALGLAAGLASAMLGIGGNVLLVPGLVLLVDYDIKRAVGTALTAVIPALLVGVATHAAIEAGNINPAASLYMICGASAGAVAGVKTLKKISSRNLQRAFALLVFALGLRALGVLKFNPAMAGFSVQIGWPFVILGAAAGASSALFGIGGGVLMVPFLHFAAGFTMHESVATSLTVIFPTVIISAILHKSMGNIKREDLRHIIPLSVIGAVSGAALSNRMSGPSLRYLFGALLVIISFSLFFKQKSR